MRGVRYIGVKSEITTNLAKRGDIIYSAYLREEITKRGGTRYKELFGSLNDALYTSSLNFNFEF